ncbi:hypothetical protein HZB88_02430 [archaeon]|nr:hypothetical protein [archaeon]
MVILISEEGIESKIEEAEDSLRRWFDTISEAFGEGYECFLAEQIGMTVCKIDEANLSSDLKSEIIYGIHETAPLAYLCSLLNYAARPDFEFYH